MVVEAALGSCTGALSQSQDTTPPTRVRSTANATELTGDRAEGNRCRSRQAFALCEEDFRCSWVVLVSNANRQPILAVELPIRWQIQNSRFGRPSRCFSPQSEGAPPSCTHATRGWNRPFSSKAALGHIGLAVKRLERSLLIGLPCLRPIQRDSAARALWCSRRHFAAR